MKRVNYHLTPKQLQALRATAKESGLSVAELIRRALDSWLSTPDAKVKNAKQDNQGIGSGE